MAETPTIPNLLSNLAEKLAYHQREEKLCAEQEALYCERRSAHAAEVERISRCYAALQETLTVAQEIAGEPSPPPAAPDPVAGVDLGTRSRPKLTRMIQLTVAEMPAGAVFGARQVTAEVNRRFAAHLRGSVDPEKVAIALQRMARAGRLHQTRRGRPYHEALYRRERPA
jgi:hypothetical protein